MNLRGSPTAQVPRTRDPNNQKAARLIVGRPSLFSVDFRTVTRTGERREFPSLPRRTAASLRYCGRKLLKKKHLTLSSRRRVRTELFRDFVCAPWSSTPGPLGAHIGYDETDGALKTKRNGHA